MLAGKRDVTAVRSGDYKEGRSDDVRQIWAKRWILALVAVLLAGTLILSSCKATTGEQGEKQNITIAVFMSNAGDPYFQNKSYGYVEAQNLLNARYPDYSVTVELYDAGGYEFSEKQISQIEDAITRGVDAIVITACNREALKPVIDTAMANGIPVVNDDVLVNTETTIEISEDSFHVGQAVADFVARKINGTGGVVMLKGPAGADLFMKRADGAHAEFARYPGIRVLAEQWHPSNIVEARRVMEDFIQAHGRNIKGVYACGTVSAMGAAEALKAAGFQPGEVIIASIDLHDEGIKYMEDGWITGLVPCQPVKLARMSVMYAFLAVTGEDVPEIIRTSDEFVVDLERLATFDLSDCMAPEGWAPPIR
ncbi:MAG: sugar ABC transporter substrate-binding protein [Bacillota bacterium]|nr:MAG: sugar ABC transporter substrate-binding protein [Bacillota bacterium]